MSNKYTIRQRVAIAELVEVLSLIGRCEPDPTMYAVTQGVCQRMHDILHRDRQPEEMSFHGMVEAKRLLAQWNEKFEGKA